MSRDFEIVVPKCESLVEMLAKRAESLGPKILFTYLLDGEEEEQQISYEELDRKARSVAALLQAHKARGERALLLYPPGLDYIIAFFGCLYAGVVAVPAYPPDPNRLTRTLPRLLSIIQSSEAKFVLTTEAIKGMGEFLFEEAPDLRKLQWISTDDVQESMAPDWKQTSFQSDDLAFLQYTSGSTGDPKGVILSHGNLLHNLKLIQHSFNLKSYTIAASWLPPYHDMGLIGGIIEPIYSGITGVLFSPLDFLQKPLRWLKAISKYKVTATGGPNFAYDLCIRKASPEIIKSLDLSSLELAFSGAESIQVETVHRFYETFKDCGFRLDTFYPCYGLAEGTLIASGGKHREALHWGSFDKKALENHRALESQTASIALVSCGSTLQDQTILIVNPETCEELKDNQVGEIWLSGKSVAQGYWKKSEETQRAFQAKTKEGKGPFLRTGDLGFLREGQLYVTGRIKDLIIIRGANHYPQDIEYNLEKANLPLRAGCGAVFSVFEDHEEKLVIAWEVDERKLEEYPKEKLFQKIKEIISQHHDLQVYAISLLSKGGVSKTSSGKIQRQATKKSFLDNSLDEFASWREEKHSTQNLKVPAIAKEIANNSQVPSEKYEQIEKWLVKALADKLGISTQEIDTRNPFQSFGLDSKDAVGISGDLEDWLQIKLSPTALWQYPDIKSLANFIGSTCLETKK